MGFGLLLLFIVVPLVELALLIKIGQQIGVWPTIALVILTAIIGTTVLRRQGLQTINRLNEATQRGEPPVGPVVDGIFLLLAGGFLLTPGILTDAVGFAFLIPPVRRLIARTAIKQFFKKGAVHIRTFEMRGGPKPDGEGSGPARPDGGPVIDGDFQRVEDAPSRRKDK